MSLLTVPPRQPTARRAAPLAAAAALHLAVVVVVTLQLKPEERLQGDGYTAVTLVAGIPGATSGRPEPAASPPAVSDRFSDLQRRLSAPRASPAATQSTPRSSADLGELLQSGQPAAGRQAAPSGGGALTDDPYSRASLGPGSTAAPSDDRLVRQARACWRGAGAASTVRVEFRLSADGALLGQPHVRRAPWTPTDDARMAAERRAIQAVIACAPYPLPPGAGTSGVYGVDLG